MASHLCRAARPDVGGDDFVVVCAKAADCLQKLAVLLLRPVARLFLRLRLLGVGAGGSGSVANAGCAVGGTVVAAVVGVVVTGSRLDPFLAVLYAKLVLVQLRLEPFMACQKRRQAIARARPRRRGTHSCRRCRGARRARVGWAPGA